MPGLIQRRRRRTRLVWSTSVRPPVARPMPSMDACRLLGGSAHSKGRIDRIPQCRPAERLEQTFHGTRFDQAGTNVFVSMSRYEDNRNRLATARQLLLKRGPAHARHRNVENQTLRLTDELR